MTKKASNQNQDKKRISLTDDFAVVEGRRPRVLVALTKSELSSQFNEVSSSLADLGFDVDISPRYRSTESLGRQAVENDVHVLLVLANTSLVTQLVESLEKELEIHKRRDILLIIKTNSPLNLDQEFKTVGHSISMGSETSIKTLSEYILNTLTGKQH